jgi:excinuclease ABC subunit B
LEKQRLEQRTLYDLELLEEVGFCSGVENYSRHLTGQSPGNPPPTLIDFYEDNFLMIIDESHMTLPQVGGMYKGDQSRKQTLVDFGFRLPSALDNRPLKFEEFEGKINKVLYVSATPAAYEIKKAEGEIVEQVIRPTGLLDPVIELRSAEDQVENLRQEILKVVKKKERILITTLTKKLAEEISTYYRSHGIKICYLHSDISTLERLEIIKELREGIFDVLVGINLLREGLDIPEVSLVAILDADKEGFLRSTSALIQTMGRAARNVEGRVILYCYKETPSMKQAISETQRRRLMQEEYNHKHGITPQTIHKKIHGGVMDYLNESLKKNKNKQSNKKNNDQGKRKEKGSTEFSFKSGIDYQQHYQKIILELKEKMKKHSKKLEFEQAAEIRDQIKKIQEMLLTL